MKAKDLQVLRILGEIEAGQCPSQRTLAKKLNVSLGLINSVVKKMAHKGYFKVTTIPKNRVKYILTPKGFAEKTRLTYEFIQYSLYFYRTARERLTVLFEDLEKKGEKNIIFYGAGDLAEIAYISLQETNLNLVGIVDDFKAGERFLAYLVENPSYLKIHEYDKCVITSIKSRDAIYQKTLQLGVPKTKIGVLN